jgi:hypothetical protein
MNLKPLKFLLIIIILICCAGVAFLILPKKKRDAGCPEREFLLKQARYPLVIRGFQFSSYDLQGKNITIKAARLRVEKMKMAFFSSGAVRLAQFKDAEIDIYVKQVESEKDLKGDSQKSIYSLKETFTKEALPAYGLENVGSLLFEPVKINFYNGKTLLTQIQAKRASIKSRDGRVVFQGHVRATSESRSLSTDKLILMPGSGAITTSPYLVFKTPENNITGNSLTTDLLLNPISLTQNTYADRRKYEGKIHPGKNEADTLHSSNMSDRIIYVQAATD